MTALKKHVLQAVDAEMTRAVLERYPKSWQGARLPRYDFSQPDNWDTGVTHVDEAQVRRRSGASDCAEVYEGYIPIDRLRPVLAEEDPTTKQYECRECGFAGERGDFGRYKECPNCEDDGDVQELEGGYDWQSFSPKAVFPVPQVRITATGDVGLDDGNHRVTYWQSQGMTHAPAWVVDERPCAKPKRRRKAK